MKKNYFLAVSEFFMVFLALLFCSSSIGQQKQITPVSQNDFWRNIQFGGGIGLNFGSGYTDISLSPSAIYNINQTVAVGIGLQGGYISSKNAYESYTYGGSLIGLVNPMLEIQLSVELEELGINTKYDYVINANGNTSYSLWNTGLYLGAGYRAGNATIGVRYNVLHDPEKSIYSEAFMPFIRVYF